MPHERASIKFNGREIRVTEGIPLAAALYEAGFAGLYRSFKYNRPRGFLSLDWTDPLRIKVDGHPFANACLLKVKGQLLVEGPSSDILKDAALLLMGRLAGVGFQDRLMFRSRLTWPIARRFIKRFLPYRPPPFDAVAPTQFKAPAKLSCDVLVVGGGVGGLSSAIAAAKAGARVMVLDGDEDLGGHLRYDALAGQDLSIDGPSAMQTLRRELEGLAISFLGRTILEGFLEDGVLGYRYEQGEVLLIEYKALVLATGSRFIPAVFENNDMPGIMLGSAALRLLNLHQIKPCSKGIVIGANLWGLRIAKQLRERGIDVTVVDGRAEEEIDPYVRSHLEDFSVLLGARVLNASGRQRVEMVGVEKDGERFRLKTNFIVMAAMKAPALELAGQLDMELGFHAELGGFVPTHDWGGRTTVPNVFVAGSLGGVIPEDALAYFSRAAGLMAAEAAGMRIKAEELEGHIRDGKDTLLCKYKPMYKAMEAVAESWRQKKPLSFFKKAFTWHGGKEHRQFVCYCLDVTASDLRKAVAVLGSAELEKVKRYCGLGTGLCQGKLCAVNAVMMLSEIAGKDPLEVGLFKQRFPASPLDLISMAGAAG